MTLLNRWLSGSSAYADYQAFVKKIVEPLFNRLGVEVKDNDPKLDRYARAVAINLACQAGLESCLTQTSTKLSEVESKNNQISPDLQSAIYCNGLRRSNSTTFFYLQNKMFQSEDQAERTLIINALGCSQDETLLTQYLNLAILPGDALRLQEKFRVLVAPVNNGELGLRVMMNFIRNNFHSIIKISPTQHNTMLSNIASRVSSKAIYDEFESLLKLLEDYEGISTSSGETHRKTAQSNLDWQVKNLDQITEWLQGDNGLETTTLGASSVIISTVTLMTCALIKYFI
jgi:aminopeptidase N